ncbi:MAG: DUF2798 domain-containing protein [Xanthobacteraceae bacterium]
MQARQRSIPGALMSSVMVPMVASLVAVLDLGWRASVRDKWVKACAVAWPVAVITALFIVPPARRSAERIVALIDGRG